jgi:outer membrane protein assembly factor BamB
VIVVLRVAEPVVRHTGAAGITSGRIRWDREVHRARPASSRYLRNSYASETPGTNGARVYAYFDNVGLFVFDMNGTPVWSKDFGKMEMRNGWGTAASPVLHVQAARPQPAR